MTFAPGVVVAQRYELREKLGEGGMGVVWSATHKITGKSVALKFLKEPENRELVGRFIREARAVSVVRHPNIIEIHDVVTLSDGRPAMVMDLLEGESLASRLKRTRTLAWDELVSLMPWVCCFYGATAAQWPQRRRTRLQLQHPAPRLLATFRQPECHVERRLPS